MPTRTFLQMTLGWFGRDPRLGLVQTPHHFYSPDPFERNLGRFRRVPNESELFHRLIQDGNDLWNASFFCGSCAVLRRAALEAIGGIAVETVTEDAHTALRMQRRGWNTAYINIPQAAGLATESLAAHIGQRIRWARGMVQILRLENPLFGPGLSIPQRLCYFNAAAHFLFAVPRLVFLTIPLVYLLLGMVNIYGHSLAVFAYALPHIVLSNMTNARVQGRHRFSFWSEVYETVLAPYVARTHAARADQSAPRQVQRDEQGRRHRSLVFRSPHRAAIPVPAGAEHRGPVHGRPVVGNRSRSPRYRHHERGMDAL